MANTNKTIILRAFNNNFFDFIDKIILYFPEHNEFKTSKTSMELLKKANPTAIIKIWFSNVCTPYLTEISSGDINFFIHKDYSNDLNNVSDNNRIMSFINDMRDNVMNLDNENKQLIMNYIQTLSRMSLQYLS